MDPQYDSAHPRNLIPEWCVHFHNLGWMSGTGGALSMKHGSEIYVTPSGVEKEKIMPEDLFVQTIEEDEIYAPPAKKKLKLSVYAQNFMLVYRLRGAGCIFHLHTKNSVLATLLTPGTEFRVCGLHMVKLLRNDEIGKNLYSYDTLVVPIIEDAHNELDHKEPIERVLEAYPEACAILIRGHGLLIWGPDAITTKSMLEAFEHILEIVVQMRQAGLDPEHRPNFPPGAIIAQSVLNRHKNSKV